MTGRTPPAARLEAYFRKEIPLSRGLGARVSRLDGNGLELSAPLAPNLNHKRTAFGGSLYALGTLAAWGAARLLLERAGLKAHVVIQAGSMTYFRPVQGDFLARCDFPPPAAWVRFSQALERKGKGRLSLRCELCPALPPASAAASGPAAVFEGVFVAMAKSAAGGA